MNHKYPRTLSEAFGPYTSNQIDEDPDPAETWTFWLAVGATILLLSIIAVLLVC